MTGAAVRLTVVSVGLAVAFTAAAQQLQSVALPVAQAAPSAQQPDPLPSVEHRDDKYKDDPKAYCFFGKPEIAMPGNPSAHACECHPTCATSATGEPQRWEDHTCEMYCTRARCLCHADEDICQPPEIKP